VASQLSSHAITDDALFLLKADQYIAIMSCTLSRSGSSAVLTGWNMLTLAFVLLLTFSRFTYLGSDVDSLGYCTPEILRSDGLASSIMSQLNRVWRQSQLSNTTKFHIYNSCVLTSLLDASEKWTLLKADTAKLEAFHIIN